MNENAEKKLSRKETRYLKRLEEKMEKKSKLSSSSTSKEKLEKIREETRIEVGKRLHPILYGLNN